MAAAGSGKQAERVLKARVGGSQALPSKGIVYYEGSWTSDEYPWLVAHGAVAAEVNYETKTATILLRYDGAFKKGTTTTLETKIAQQSGAQSATANAETINTYVFSLQSAGGDQKDTRGVSVPVKQNLRFTASTISLAAIDGKYTSKSPRDSGKFQMHAISKERFQEFAQASGSCTIM
jgi:hypothetical protein